MSAFSLPLESSFFTLAGVVFLLAGLAQAVRHRRRHMTLLSWLTLTDGGYIFIGMACGGDGSGAAMAQALFAGAARVLAYLSLAGLIRFARSTQIAGITGTVENGEGRDRASLNGIGKARPVTATLYALGMFAALGVSPFLTPDAKPVILQATLAAGQILLPVLLTLANVAGVVLTVCAVHGIWLGNGAYRKDTETLPFLLLVLAGLVAGMGIFAHDFTAFAARLAGMNAAAHGLPVFVVSWHQSALLSFVGGFFVFLLGVFAKPLRNPVACLIMAAAFVAALADSSLPPLGRLFTVLSTGMGLLITVYSTAYIHGRNENAYFALLLMLFGSLAGVGTATNVGGMYVFWELMTFTSYILVAYEGTDKAHAAAIKYFIMCGVAAAVMLPGLLLLGSAGAAGEAGTLDMAALASGTGVSPGVLTLVGMLTLVGFGVKAGLVPGHGWLPDAHPAAPSSISAPLSGILTKAGIFGLVQVFLVIFGTTALTSAGSTPGSGTSGVPFLGGLLCLLGLITMAYGELMALRQQDIKRLLAYSTMGQIGEIAITLGVCSWLAVTGALLHVVNHAVMKDLLFLCSGALIMRAGGRNLADLRGLGRVMPLTAGCMVIGLISIMGLPPFAGFMSKYLMVSALAAVSPLLAGLMLVASLSGCIYYMRIVRTLIFEPYSGPPVEEVPLAMRGVLVSLTSLCVLMGLFPNIGLSLVLPVVQQLAEAGKLTVGVLPSLTVDWPLYTLLLILGGTVPVWLRRDPYLAGRATAWLLVSAAVLVLLFGRHLDSLSYLFALIIPTIGAVNIFYSTGYMAHSHTQWRFYAFFLCMCAGLTGVAASTDLFNFFLFWEIMSSWSLYFVIVHEETPSALREGFKYFFFNMVGAAFIFLGVALLVSWSGGASFVVVREALPALSSGRIGAVLFLLATGFIMKAAQLPFRIDVQMHPATAPTPVSGYISSVLLKSALFGLAKLFLVLGGGIALAGVGGMDKAQIMNIAIWVGGITIVMAAGFAVFQSDIKLVLIYSTVSQLGYMVVGIALGTSLGVAGGLLHLVNHVLFKDLLFLVAGSLILRTHRQSMDSMGGIGAKMPVTLAFFAIGALCVIGVPPSNGFTSKWIIYHALMEQGHVVVAILSLVGSVLTLAYFAKMLHTAFLGSPSPGMENVTEAPRSMLLPMGVLAAGCVVTSVFPGLILGPLNSVLAEFSLTALDVAPWGLASGRGAWNATATTVLFGAAWYCGRYVLTRLTCNERGTNVHTCGIPPEELNVRTTSRDIYSSPGHLFARLGRKHLLMRLARVWR